jgi:hypothetical protein
LRGWICIAVQQAHGNFPWKRKVCRGLIGSLGCSGYAASVLFAPRSSFARRTQALSIGRCESLRCAASVAPIAGVGITGSQEWVQYQTNNNGFRGDLWIESCCRNTSRCRTPRCTGARCLELKRSTVGGIVRLKA